MNKWTKTDDGYAIVDPKWGANLKLVTDKVISDSDLESFLQWVYRNTKDPLRRGGNYELFPMGPI